MNSDSLFGTPGVWERIIGARDLVWPDDDVIRCTQRFFGGKSPEERAALTAFDIGFGTGQHTLYLALEGFQVTGIDVADVAMQRTREKLVSARLKADIRQEELSTTSFEDNSFDYVVAWGVLFLKPDTEIGADLRKIYDLMRPGGILLANFRTLNNWFYGLGEQQGNDLYLLDERAEEYQGILYRFFSKDDLAALLTEAGFETVYIEYKEWHKFGTKQHSWWLATARK
ncbi:MAG: methyltransferase domain-containing protein, partial [Chloroflexi bacterium]|nr:methyltransferase domain-containing protein [Chloroflexota bacterium]